MRIAGSSLEDRWRTRTVAPAAGYGETTVVPGTTTLETFARDLVAPHNL